MSIQMRSYCPTAEVSVCVECEHYVMVIVPFLITLPFTFGRK